jgi:hypothetical protein
METDLSSLFGGSGSPIDILSKLLEQDNIYIKSQQNMKQIKIICKTRWLAEIKKEENKDKTGMQILDEKIIPLYLMLMCSYKRRSRTEIIDAIKNLNDKLMPQTEGVIPSMMGGK